MTSPDEVLEYWFGELHDGIADQAHRKRWFQPDAAVDAEIRDRFSALLTAAANGELTAWRDTPVTALALVLVCDQFPRQIHRGSVRAFETDPLALETARLVVDGGGDGALALDERAFLYMPFEHSESRLDQHTAVGLFTALLDDATDGYRHHAENFLDYARRHRDIVRRFGRFPHRNRVLGRTATAEEHAFLETASDFGQSAR